MTAPRYSAMGHCTMRFARTTEVLPRHVFNYCRLPELLDAPAAFLQDPSSAVLAGVGRVIPVLAWHQGAFP